MYLYKAENPRTYRAIFIFKFFYFSLYTCKSDCLYITIPCYKLPHWYNLRIKKMRENSSRNLFKDIKQLEKK